MEPEIKFVKKVIAMRKQAAKNKRGHKPGATAHALWLERHIQANKYNDPKEAQSFMLRHSARIEYVMIDKPAINDEYFKLISNGT